MKAYQQPMPQGQDDDAARAEWIKLLLRKLGAKESGAKLNGAGVTRIDMRTGEAQEDAG